MPSMPTARSSHRRSMIMPRPARSRSARSSNNRSPARAAPLVRLLWHVEGSANLRGILRDPRIASPRESERFNLEMSAVYAAFAGLCIALLCYNFALWAALRHPFSARLLRDGLRPPALRVLDLGRACLGVAEHRQHRPHARQLSNARPVVGRGLRLRARVLRAARLRRLDRPHRDDGVGNFAGRHVRLRAVSHPTTSGCSTRSIAGRLSGNWR